MFTHVQYEKETVGIMKVFLTEQKVPSSIYVKVMSAVFSKMLSNIV